MNSVSTGLNDQGQISKVMLSRLEGQGLVENTCGMNTTSPRKGIRMSNPSDTFRSLLHRLGVVGPARLDASQGSGAPSALLHPQGAGAPAAGACASSPHRFPTTPLVLFMAIATLALAPSVASAARGHVFSGKTIGAPCATEPCVPGTLKEPAGVAVNEATGDIYVLDKADGLITDFEKEGNVVATFGNNGTGGAPNGQLNGPSAEGSGTVTAGETTIAAVIKSAGEFTVGEEITASEAGVQGLEAGTTIEAVELGAGTLTLSKPAEKTLVSAELKAHQSFAAPTDIAVDNSCQLHKPVLSESTVPTCAEFDPSDGDIYIA